MGGLGLASAQEATIRSFMSMASPATVGSTATVVTATFTNSVLINTGSIIITARNPATGQSVAVSPDVVGSATSKNWQQYSVPLRNLQDNTEYTVKFAAGGASHCTKNRTGEECTVARPADTNTESNSIKFTVVASGPSATVSSLTSTTITSGTTDVAFALTFSRDVVAAPNVMDSFLARGRPSNVDSQGRQLTSKDVLFGTNKWDFVVAGVNGDDIRFNLRAGAAQDMAGNGSSASTPPNFTRTLVLRTDCKTKEVEGAYSQCVNNMRTKTITTVIVADAMYGGAACPSILTRTVPSSCTPPPAAPVMKSSCSGRCNAIADGVSANCSCDKECVIEGDCCTDMGTFCPASMPTCNGAVLCGAKAMAAGGSVLCSCDAGCGVAGGPKCCSGYTDTCTRELCAVRHARGTGAKPSWCTRSFVAKPVEQGGDEGYPCACTNDCMTTGDCCNDFAATCQVKTICAHSGNCGFSWGLAAGPVYGCACDHACLKNGDCCSDYQSLCETQATCMRSCGTTPWDSSNDNTKDRWCGCDSECTGAGDCCTDYRTMCA